MRLSVIVSTYNQPDWLELVLWGLSVQTCGEFELLIADDGSDERTGRVLDRLRSETRLCRKIQDSSGWQGQQRSGWPCGGNVRAFPSVQTRPPGRFPTMPKLQPIHVWHEDRGFRKCAILNQAIEQASGDYLIFLDGDCIPRADFVDQHVRLAERGRFLSGGAVRLSRDTSCRITPPDVTGGRVHDRHWLRKQGMPASRDLLKLLGNPVSWGNRVSAGRLLDATTTTKPTFNGGNASAWKKDLLQVNGFDERMGHGGLDRELGERLENAGIHGKQVRHRCMCVHLDHPRAYANAAVKAFNDRLRRQTRQSQAVWTPHGIVKAAARAA